MKKTLNTSFHVSNEHGLPYMELNPLFQFTDQRTGWLHTAGKSRLYLFDAHVEDWTVIRDIAHTISPRVGLVMDTLEKIKDRESIYGMVAVIDEIEVYEPYRGKGYGRELLKEMEATLDFMYVNYIALVPASPGSEYQTDSATIHYFLEQGYQLYAGSIGSIPVVGKSL
ncbi:GNAT family N-acetyltransferase [Bacillus daqingensis]|uniref:GNAT family N-acetyltransferase n=1 Tax=Bacillus daqingensis TaxID=872396 RepID=A0ABV9NVG5_9BACI